MGAQRVLVVSGAASGLGLASAVRFASGGYDVGLIDIDQVRGEQAAQKVRALGRQALFCACDVTDKGQVTGAAREIKRDLGRVDALHNNAGVQVRGGILRCTEEDWDRLYDVTVKGIFHMTRAFVPLMAGRTGCAIVNTGSILGTRAADERAAYAGAKAAVDALTRSMAVDLAAPGHPRQLRGGRRDRHAAAAALHQGLPLPGGNQVRADGQVALQPLRATRRGGQRGLLPLQRGGVVRHWRHLVRRRRLVGLKLTPMKR